jgi:hypothetical protein
MVAYSEECGRLADRSMTEAKERRTKPNAIDRTILNLPFGLNMILCQRIMTGATKGPVVVVDLILGVN